MKKTFLIAAIALLALGMASCKKDDNTKQTPTAANPWENPNPGTTSGQWVDLGLPSGLQWYSVNLGAAAPEHYGDYYALGETSTKDAYHWGNYAYGSEMFDITKYCNDTLFGHNGFGDNLRTLLSSDDAATAVMGSGVRMPTQAEWQELVDNTTGEWTTLNNVKGYKFTATNGNSLFLPAAGWRNGEELLFAGEEGYYWSSSLFRDGAFAVWDLKFGGSEYLHVDFYDRRYGTSVRAVRPRS